MYFRGCFRLCRLNFTVRRKGRWWRTVTYACLIPCRNSNLELAGHLTQPTINLSYTPAIRSRHSSLHVNMRPSFLKDYLPISQQEGVEDTEKLERGASRWSVWIRWIPWTLVLCLVLSNWLALAKLRNQRISNEIFCIMLKRKVRKIHTQLLTNRSSSVEGDQIQKSGISCGHRQ
jgi:hypothetical protein